GPAHARQPLGIVENMIGHRHSANNVLQPQNVLAVQNLAHGGLHVGGSLPHDQLFLAVGWIIHLDQEQEAVELGLGQGIGAFLLDGVLSSKNEERVLHGIVGAADG